MLRTTLARRLAATLTLLALARPAAAGGQADARHAPADTARIASAILEGVVRDSAGRTLHGAVVTVESLSRSVLSDSAGRFRLAALPSDTLEVSVRRVGYAPAYFALAIPPDTRVSIAVKMLPALQTLGVVTIDGERRQLYLQQNGFYERRRLGRGHLFDSTFLRAREALNLATVLREVPGVRVSCRLGASGCVPTFVRGTQSCVPSLWVDGFKQHVVDDFEQIVAVPDIMGLEVYLSSEAVPIQFRQTRDDMACGAVVVWTKWTH